jgi:hypothetical protein
MRTSIRFLLVLPLVLAGAAVRADDREPAAVLAAALQAHGGADALAKTRLMSRSDTGVMAVLPGQEVPFSDELTLQLPQRWRWILEAGPPGQKSLYLVTVNGDRGWQAAGGAPMEMSKNRLEEVREEGYVMWLATLLPLKTDSDFRLSSLPDARVDGRPAAVLNITHPGHGDVKLSFDKESGLLVKAERRGKEAGIVVTKEYQYGNHKDFDGVKLPTRYAELTNGKKFVDVTAATYKFLSRVDDSTFARP